MKAIKLNNFGSAEQLQWVEMTEPTPKAHQYLVKVNAAALNRADILQRKGHYAPPAGDSTILGLDVAGEIVAAGEHADKSKIGQKVFGLVSGGGYAEYCLMDSQMAIEMPNGWSYVDAAAIPEAFFTANETVFELGQLQAGESVLIHAGASGVGTAAIQMAVQQGAEVYFTVGSDEKIDRVLALGAKAGINYKKEHVAQKIRLLTQQQGVDVIEDFLGAAYLSEHLQLLKPGGRLISVALMDGYQAELDMRLMIKKRLQIKGSIMRSRTLTDKRAIAQRFVQRWLPLLKEGKIKPIIDRVFPLADAASAHAYLERSQHVGKVVLQVR